MEKINWIKFIKYLIVAICSAILSYLGQSCTTVITMGTKNTTDTSTQFNGNSADSTKIVPTLNIK